MKYNFGLQDENYSSQKILSQLFIIPLFVKPFQSQILNLHQSLLLIKLLASMD